MYILQYPYYPPWNSCLYAIITCANLIDSDLSNAHTANSNSTTPKIDKYSILLREGHDKAESIIVMKQAK